MGWEKDAATGVNSPEVDLCFHVGPDANDRDPTGLGTKAALDRPAWVMTPSRGITRGRVSLGVSLALTFPTRLLTVTPSVSTTLYARGLPIAVVLCRRHGDDGLTNPTKNRETHEF